MADSKKAGVSDLSRGLDQTGSNGMQVQRVIEALLFSGGQALTACQIAELLDGCSEQHVVEAIAELNQCYFRQSRPYEIRRVGSRYQLNLRPPFLSVSRRLVGRGREVKLSVAAIEVLALVAYKQPVSLGTIDAMRGIDSAAIVRQLRRRNLIEPADPPAGEARTAHFKTTRRFLDLFRLPSLDELPRVQELEKG